MGSKIMSGEKVKVMNLDELSFEKHGHGEGFEAECGQIARPLGAEMLGYQIIKIPAGKKPFPLHFHYANEEMFLVMEGSGTLRDGASERPLRVGDVIAGPGSEHQIVGGPGGISVLAVSTRVAPEVVEYPESNKVGVFGGAPGADPSGRTIRQFMPKAEVRDYWDGEL
jgi:uncharacterized cupin superfamily protein